MKQQNEMNVKIAEMLTCTGHSVHRAGRIRIGNQVYENAVSYSGYSGETRVYILGDPLPSVLRTSPTLVDEAGNPWYIGSYSPPEIKPEHVEYSPFGRWFMIFQSDSVHYTDRGNVKPTRRLRWLTPR